MVTYRIWIQSTACNKLNNLQPQESLHYFLQENVKQFSYRPVHHLTCFDGLPFYLYEGTYSTHRCLDSLLCMPSLWPQFGFLLMKKIPNCLVTPVSVANVWLLQRLIMAAGEVEVTRTPQWKNSQYLVYPFQVVDDDDHHATVCNFIHWVCQAHRRYGHNFNVNNWGNLGIIYQTLLCVNKHPLATTVDSAINNIRTMRRRCAAWSTPPA